MSLNTRIRGFTSWINFRLAPYGSNLSNVLTELFEGFHIQQLLHSLTCRSLKSLKSFDGLTEQQKTTRIQWFVEELKKIEILSEDIIIDCRLVALQSQPNVFDLLWRLVCNDVWFLWKRLEFLEQDDESVLTSAVFKWTPEAPPKKKKRVYLTEDAVLGGNKSTEDDQVKGYDKFPGSEKMFSFKSDHPIEREDLPNPEDCIIDMINTQLRKASEGRNIEVDTLEDLTCARVLCGLVNSFVPGTFTTEILLDDRWTIDLVLNCVEKMLNFPNNFKCEDICENNRKSVCSYFSAFFIQFYHYKQSQAAVNRLKELNLLIQETHSELEGNGQLQKDEIEKKLDDYVKEKSFIRSNYEIDDINEWIQQVSKVQQETLEIVSAKIHERFNLIKVPRSMTVNDLMSSCAVNLQLTNGSCFVLKNNKQSIFPNTRFVLKRKSDGTFIDNFTDSLHSVNLHQLLKLPCYDITVVEPLKHPKYQFYFECESRNKMLKAGTIVLYQIFPGNLSKWEQLLIRSIKENDFDIVQKLVIFFKIFHPPFIDMQISPHGNSLLHVAARYGNFDICKYLLRNGCDVNARNKSGTTSLFMASQHLHKNICQLLIEWGCDVEVENFKKEKALSLMRHENMRKNLQDVADNWKKSVPELVKNNAKVLKEIIDNHLNKSWEIADLEARCVCGSTLLHTAVHFAHLTAIKDLLKLRIDINLEDFQAATPLHRAKNLEVLKLLLDSNADVNAVDRDGNTCLHVRCYGEKNKESFLTGIQLLITYGCDVAKRNKSQMMPVHCAAIQGRQDVLELFVDHHEDLIKTEISKESADHPPSLPYLALSNNFLEIAQWLIEKGFSLKPDESDQLLYRILSDQLKLDDAYNGVELLLRNNASLNLFYSEGDSILHLAVRMNDCYDVTKLLIKSGASCDVSNDCGQTPLFDSVKSNQFQLFMLLLDQAPDIDHCDHQGLTCFDFVHDFDEWISFPHFPREVIDRLKIYKMKHTRDLVQVISRKVQRSFPPNKQQFGHKQKGFLKEEAEKMKFSKKELRKLSATMNGNYLKKSKPQPLPPRLMLTSASIL